MATPSPTVAPNPVKASNTSNIRFVWCTAIANMSSPTIAEITAGTDFTEWIGKGDISGFELSAATITTDSIGSGIDIPLKDGQSVSGTPTVVFKRPKVATTGSPASVFSYGVSGFAVLLDAPTFATTGALMDIWSVDVGSASASWTGEKTTTVTFTPNAVPVFRVAVPTV